MGRKVVEEVVCDRCDRVQHVEAKANAANVTANKQPIFTGTFNGETVTYNDLCEPCTQLITLRWAEIDKEMKKHSPVRDRSKLLTPDGQIKAPTVLPVGKPPELKPQGPSQRS